MFGQGERGWQRFSAWLPQRREVRHLHFGFGCFPHMTVEEGAQRFEPIHRRPEVAHDM